MAADRRVDAVGARGQALDVENFATRRLPLDTAPDAYETFQKKQDGMVKVVLKP